ncbi:MAG: hypothetical protein H7645_08810 [Candidatus Heimdallarchaeota archaeon]|nr:hypothetical protein [Candidatus Heimdallarchaeota archaeon]MCK4770425.1 hypothetical protein [Candidatus Heimdallarchaeota archaeon]
MGKSDKIEVDYKGLKAIDSDILKRVNDVFKVETKHAIIMVIKNFGSSNIKKLAKILAKNEATIYHHLQDLTREPKLLQIDEEKTRDNKGIFYKLSEIAERHFGEPSVEIMETKLEEVYDKILNQSDENLYRIYIEMLANHPDIGNQAEKERRSLAYNHILENIMINNLEGAEKALIKNKKPKNPDYPLGSIANFPLDMKISKPRHLFEILKLFNEMSVKFYKLKEKIENEMDKEKILEENRINIHYHVIGGEIAEFEFEK